MNFMSTAEHKRLTETKNDEADWRRWGPYLSERQWGTVREDYSADGSFWSYFPHDHARSRAYRWGEDGLLGWSDRNAYLCFAPALWNGNDPILKERLFGLTGPEGNHGEDVKECYYYLDGSPSHAYMKGLYKYPQRTFPYRKLVRENQSRGKHREEYELLDTGIFDQNRYFDVFIEYAKAGPEDLMIRLRAVNRGPDPAPLHVLPTLWFRNTWSWGWQVSGYTDRPEMSLENGAVRTRHEEMDPFRYHVDVPPEAGSSEWLFTENETNHKRLFGSSNTAKHVKDAFHQRLIDGREDAVNPERTGTKAARHLQFDIPPGEERVVRARLVRSDHAPDQPFDDRFPDTFQQRRRETDRFYGEVIPDELDEEETEISRQAYAGLLWTKQFYFYDVRRWLEGDPNQPNPPSMRRSGRNNSWEHLHNQDVISMPDKWEYPWYAAWDLAFHMLSFSRVDPEFAKDQLEMFLEERYMNPDGAIPAYEAGFSDANPPVHAWAVWRVYKMSDEKGDRDDQFLARCFQKLLLNFTWWVNRKDQDDNEVFSGGFLGLDNIGVFDRSSDAPVPGHLEQADGTAWMGFYCGTMLSMALELAQDHPEYEAVANKFLEHYIAIADAINELNGTGLWNEEDAFFYDHLHCDGNFIPLNVRSLVGLMPLVAVEPIEETTIQSLPNFRDRLERFQENRRDTIRFITCDRADAEVTSCNFDLRLLALPNHERLKSMLSYMLDEEEFLSPHGIRSVSRYHRDHPFSFSTDGETHTIRYEPGESRSYMYGGNSNWRGPVWFPVNYLLIEALERYHYFYGDQFTVEFPTGSGEKRSLDEVAKRLSDRLADLFRDGEDGRPAHGDDDVYHEDPNWDDLILFYEYFHGDTGRGCGASHQTGWTALVAQCLEKVARFRSGE